MAESESFIPPEALEPSETPLGDLDLVPYNPETDEGSVFVRRPDVPFRMYEPVTIKNKAGQLESTWQFVGVMMYDPESVNIQRVTPDNRLQNKNIPIEEFKQLNSRELLSEKDISKAKVNRILTESDLDRHGHAMRNNSLDQLVQATGNQLFQELASSENPVPSDQKLREFAELQRDKDINREKQSTNAAIRTLEGALRHAEQQESVSDMKETGIWLDRFRKYQSLLEEIG